MFAVPEHTVLRPTSARPLSLAALVRGVAAEAGSWLHLLHTSGTLRVPVPSEDPRAELWLAAWPPGRPATLEHHQEQGAFAVVSGQLTEHTLSGSADATSRTLRPGQVRVHGPGYRHSITNTGSKPAVTVHVKLRPRAI
jgi:mannose-6-phosphate isomerase-like protein (cupin superfamily)